MLSFATNFQSDREKEEGLPVAPFMDREKVTKPTAQIGFIKFVLLPMFEAIAKVPYACLDSHRIIWRETLICVDHYVKRSINQKLQMLASLSATTDRRLLCHG